MQYTTLTYNGTEKSLADWGIGKWRRECYNQASDSFVFELQAATDAAEIFPYGSMIKISTGRTPAAGPSASPAGLPLSGVREWTGGQGWFAGWRVENVRTGTARLEEFQYQFAGPWDFFFERLVFQKLWLTWNGVKQIADWRSQVVLGMSVNCLSGAGDTVTGTTTTNLMSLSQQLMEIAGYVASQSSYEQTVNGLGWPGGPQIQFDTLTTDGEGNYQLATARANCQIPDFVPGHAGSNGDIAATTSGKVLRAPLDAVNDMTCAECFRRMLRWIGAVGSPVTWFDYSTTPPTLKVSTRDQLPAVTRPLVGGALPSAATESIKIQRRDDLMPSAIAFKYRISGQVWGTPYSVMQNDIAARVDGACVEGVGLFGALTDLAGGALSPGAQNELGLQARRLAAQMGTFDFEGESTTGASGSILTAPLNLGDPAGGGAALAAWTALFPQLANVSNLAFYQDSGGAIAPAVVDEAGAPVSPGSFPNILLDGNVAPWMYVNNSPTNHQPGQCVQATITAWFQYQDNSAPAGDPAISSGTVQYHQLTTKVKLTNLTTGAYNSIPQVTPGEPVPYGLAGYIFAMEQIPQYQGSLTVMEQEISDVCPIGHNLNLTGGLAEWAAMRACVQQVNYDDTGKTEIIFGPAQHLGNADLVERLRVNRGPRWYNLIGNDLLNKTPGSGPTALGQYAPLSSPIPGTRLNSDKLLPQSVKDLESHLSAYTRLLPGVYAWTKGAGRSGLSLVDNGPGLALAGGSAGNLDAQYILISVAQLLGVVAGQPAKFCELMTCEPGAPSGQNSYRAFLCTDVYYK
ncbi:MAG: hypothetical protein ABSG04_01520 [Verrucomicrobiota bacterium]|jgi:hypothetical protein